MSMSMVLEIPADWRAFSRRRFLPSQALPVALALFALGVRGNTQAITGSCMNRVVAMVTTKRKLVSLIATATPFLASDAFLQPLNRR
jgi:hypothetical protein